MNTVKETSVADAQTIERDLLAQYVRIQLVGKFALLLALLINAAALLMWESWQNVALWSGFSIGFWALSLVMCHKFGDGSQVARKDLKAWYLYIGAPRLAYNMMWFSVPFWGWSAEHPETYHIVAAILMSTLAMNASQSAAVFPFYLLEMLPKILGIVLTASTSGDTLQYTIAALAVTGSLVFTKIAYGINQSTRTVLTQKYQIIKAKDDIERASRAKSSFLATMSHEVRTPLNGILGIVNLMKYTKLDKQQDEYIETMRYSGETLLTMLNDILDFSKMEAGKLDLEEVPLDTSRLVDSVTDLLESRAHEKKIKIVTDIGKDIPNYIKADPTRLRQVLLNLMSNAIKFTDKGSVTIRIKKMGVPCEDNRVMLRFEVVDTGIGIPEAAREHLFKDFQQADSSTSRKYGGTGLGLSISRRIIESMKGTIGFESIEEKGSTFWFELPLRVSTAQELQNIAEKSEDYPAFKPLKILLAEDNAINQKVAVGLLQKFGHSVDIANDGEEAVRAVQEKPYDLVLMDMQMPVVDGLQATRRIRDMGGDYAILPIIALSANSLTEEGLDYDSAGITDHVLKPIRLGHLFKTMAHHLPAHIQNS